MLAEPSQVDIGRSFREGLDTFFGYLPNVLGFLVLLLIGYIVAKVLAAIVGKLLEKVGLDRRLHDSDANRYVEGVMPGGASPSRGIAGVVFWLVFIFFIFMAIGALQIPAVTTFMNQVLAYLPNIIAAILIFVIAAILAGAIGGAVARVMGDTPTGKIIATVVPALIMVIAVFMILTQLRIAEEIVTIAFAAIMFALALGLALAFGLGGRPLAQQLLEDGYRVGREHKEQAKRDLQAGRARAEEEARSAQSQVQGGGDQYGSHQYTGGGTYSGSGQYDQPTQYEVPGEYGTGSSSEQRY
ncbi:MAG: transporter [Actinomycetota bacterium]|nr:transporter [Actinomycetota bacterium]